MGNIRQIGFGSTWTKSDKGLSLIEVLLIIAIVSLLLVAIAIRSLP